MVTSDPGAHFRIFTESGKISIVFFQTSYMKKMLSLYPDVLYIDSTYCLNLYGYPVVVFMIVDGDNVGHCVGYACVRDEKMATLSVLFSEFVRKNEGVNVKTVVVDKDASEIGAVRQTMPGCNLILCRFHVAKTMYEAVRKYCTRGEQEEVMGFVRRNFLFLLTLYLMVSSKHIYGRIGCQCPTPGQITKLKISSLGEIRLIILLSATTGL